MSSKHSLHKIVGEIFENELPTGYSLLKDIACGGNQQVPLFHTDSKSRKTKYCDVDLLVLKDNKIRMIVEIEESNVKPTQICGKFLTSALSNYYIHNSKNNEPIKMDDSVTFLQIVDTSKLTENKTAKFKQWKALEKSINDLIHQNNGNIKSYKLLSTDKEHAHEDLTFLIKETTQKNTT